SSAECGRCEETWRLTPLSWLPVKDDTTTADEKYDGQHRPARRRGGRARVNTTDAQAGTHDTIRGKDDGEKGNRPRAPGLRGPRAPGRRVGSGAPLPGRTQGPL